MELFNKLIATTQKIENTIKASAVCGMLWIVVALILGLIAQLQLFIKIPLPFGYGLLRPIYTSTLLFGGLLSLFNAAIYYILYKENNDTFVFSPLAFIAYKLQQIAVIAGIVTILLGLNKGREYGEFTYISDHLLILSLLITLIVSILNIKKSGQLTIKSSYIIATVAGMLIVYTIGNAGLPFSPYASVSLFTGMQDQAIQEIYRIGVLSFFIIMPAITLLVVFVPEYYDVELYSEKMARFHIVASTLILPVAGAGWLAGTVAPPLLQTLGVFAYFSFFVAILAGILNIHFTITKSGKKFQSDPLGSLLRFGGFLLMIYVLVRLIFITGFLRDYSDYTYLNTRDLSQDAASYAILILLAVSFYYFQKMNDHTFSQKSLSSLLYIGGTGMFIILIMNTIQGLAQGANFLQLDDKREIVEKNWVNILSSGSGFTIDIKTTADFLQVYLSSFRSLLLVGYILVLVSVLFTTVAFIIAIRKSKNDGYQKPNLGI